MTLSEARELATEAIRTAKRGVDPQNQKVVERTGVRFDQTAELYVQTYCAQHNRESTRRETERLLKARFVSRWGARDLREITKADVLEIIDEAVANGTPSAANHAVAVIRALFNWCLDRGLIESSPCARIKMPAKTVSRERVLTDVEIAAVWSAACGAGYPFGTIVRLLLLTAQRRNEVTKMRWADIDGETGIWSIPKELTKNGVAQTVPLVPLALEILKGVPHVDRELVFPSRAGGGRAFSGFSRSKRRLAVAAEIEPFRLHDFRRTISTKLASFGVAPHVTERLLNHVSGILGGVAGVYNRFKYIDEMRDALTRWSDHVEALASGGGDGTTH